MSLSAVAAKIRESNIYCLWFNDKIVGFRVKSFNIDTDNFEYYDFSKDYVTDEKIKDFINKNVKKFEGLKLEHHGNQFLTQDELNGRVQVAEFKDTANANSLLARVIKVLTCK